MGSVKVAASVHEADYMLGNIGNQPVCRAEGRKPPICKRYEGVEAVAGHSYGCR